MNLERENNRIFLPLPISLFLSRVHPLFKESNFITTPSFSWANKSEFELGSFDVFVGVQRQKYMMQEKEEEFISFFNSNEERWVGLVCCYQNKY